MLSAINRQTKVNLLDRSPPASYVHGNFQARIPEWVAISYSRGSSWPRDRTQVSCAAGRFFTDSSTREALQGILSEIITVWAVKKQGEGEKWLRDQIPYRNQASLTPNLSIFFLDCALHCLLMKSVLWFQTWTLQMYHLCCRFYWRTNPLIFLFPVHK